RRRARPAHRSRGADPVTRHGSDARPRPDRRSPNASPMLIDWMIAVVVGWLAVGVVGVLALRRLRFVSRVLFPLGALLGIVLAALAAAALFDDPQVIVLPIGLPTLPFHLRIDALSAFFLLVIGTAVAGVSTFAAGYFRQ